MSDIIRALPCQKKQSPALELRTCMELLSVLLRMRSSAGKLSIATTTRVWETWNRMCL